jgi:hypothetical protein
MHNVPDACKEARKWVKDDRHHQLQEVSVGARMMVTENIDVPNGVANSATCTCTNVITDKHGVVQWIEGDMNQTCGQESHVL